MARSKRLIFASLIVLALVHLNEARAAEPLADWQGYWKLSSITRQDEEQDLSNDQIVVSFQDDKFLYGSDVVGTLRVSGETNPQTIDLTLAGTTEAIEGIYTVEDDTVKICFQWDLTGVKERPSDFSTKDLPARRLLVLKRAPDIKKGEEPPARGFVGLVLRRDENTEELVIADTIPNSPARKAGVEAEDVLQQIDGAKFADLVQAVARVRRSKPGSELTVNVRRKDEPKEIRIKVGTFPFRLFVD
jgi:uncharacterized protein (TIGR03067 family)